MNLEKLIQLRDHLVSVPDNEFDYENFYLNKSDPDAWSSLSLRDDPPQHCGTAGCVAGHAKWLWPELFRQEQGRHINDSTAIGNGVLGLNGCQQYFLFIENCGDANRLDAIARLDWLIAGYD